MLARLTTVIALAILVSGCIPTTYFQEGGRYYMIVDRGEENDLYRLSSNGNWYRDVGSQYRVANEGRKLDAKQVNAEIRRRQPPTDGEGEGGHY